MATVRVKWLSGSRLDTISDCDRHADGRTLCESKLRVYAENRAAKKLQHQKANFPHNQR